VLNKREEKTKKKLEKKDRQARIEAGLEEPIDYWKTDPFKPGDMPEPLTEESSFALLFPAYREKYLREIWPVVTKELGKYGLKCVLDLHQGCMTVMTSRRTWDPWAILNARDFIKLLARSVPYEQALRVFEDGVVSEIVKIGNVTRNKQKFIKRRQRLIGPNGQTLKAIELLTKCYVLVMGSTVSVIGTAAGIKQVRIIVLDCMRNIHPVYHIKQLMIKKELSKNPALAEESWDRFLPKFKSKSRKKKVLLKRKKKYTPFPPAPTPRKIDMELETGEYFLKQEQVLSNKIKEKRIKQAEKSKDRQLEREKDFIPPDEDNSTKTEKDDNIASSVQNIRNFSLKRKSYNRGDSKSDYILPSKRTKTFQNY